jgi:hypothetical protein
LRAAPQRLRTPTDSFRRTSHACTVSAMSDLTGHSQSGRHSLLDWLALHELEHITCRRILDAMTLEAAGEPAAHDRLNLGYQAPDLEVAWQRTVEAMRGFFSERQDIIEDTFEKTEKIVVDQCDKSRKALTLDNGPTAYPTILFSYRGEPSDWVVLAHEFGHALQIRASRGKFVPPIMREVCAFLGEGALLSHSLRHDAAQYPHLAQVWREDSFRYFGVQRDRLQADLLRPAALYKYAWNYPIARYLAVRIAERCSRDWIWSVFAGEISVRDALGKLAFPPGQSDFQSNGII